MILIIHIHNVPFHYFEFVRPLEDILTRMNVLFSSHHYKDIKKEDIDQAEKIIIAGTSLKDQVYLSYVDKFHWIKTCSTPILGICGGMHILAAVHDEHILKGQEIGLTTITLEKECLGKNGDIEVYELHNNYVNPKTFTILGRSNQYPQAIKHPEKPLYGVLFHPEVRNKKMIHYFINTI